MSRVTSWLAHGREGSLRWWLYLNVVCGIFYARQYGMNDAERIARNRIARRLT